jgi:dephospho-CoA kinase
MFVLGLTGSIGMGKSTTALMFRRRGIKVFDSDATVHSLYEGEACDLVEAAFPGTVVNGRIDRGLLGNQVLRDPLALAKLEGIIHPLVREKRSAFLWNAASLGGKLAVLDVPLLFETGQAKDCDAVLLVSAPERVQRARLEQRQGMTPEHLAVILAKQMPDAEKRLGAHFMIDTSYGFPAAERAVDGILRALAGCPGRVRKEI